MIPKNLLILLCLSVSAVYAQETLSIDSCYAMAKRNYPAIKQYELIEKSKEYTISNANKAYLPQFSLTGIGGFVTGFPDLAAPGTEATNSNFKFIGIGQVSQTIWDGGATHVQKDITKASSEVERANLETSLYAIRERVNQLYFGILLIDEQLNQLSALRENLGRTLHKVTLSKENGIAYQSDVDEVNAEVLVLDQKVVELNYVRVGYLLVLSHLIGKNVTETTVFQKPVTVDPTAQNNRPELKLYASQKQLIESQTSINRAHNMPKVGLVGYGLMLRPEASLGPAAISNIFVGGLSVSWSTANLYKTSNSKQLDKIQLDRISNQEETFVFNNNLQLKQSMSEIEKQKAILAKDAEIITLKEKIKQAYQHKYDNGLCTMNDLVNSVYKESEARNNQSLHTIQLLLSQYNYKTQSGN